MSSCSRGTSSGCSSRISKLIYLSINLAGHFEVAHDQTGRRFGMEIGGLLWHEVPSVSHRQYALDGRGIEEERHGCAAFADLRDCFMWAPRVPQHVFPRSTRFGNKWIDQQCVEHAHVERLPGLRAVGRQGVRRRLATTHLEDAEEVELAE